jgi:hypothetical protein
MTAHAITRPAQPRDAHAIALMSRDLWSPGWKTTPRAARDARPRHAGAGGLRPRPTAGFAPGIGEERAHPCRRLRPVHRRLASAGACSTGCSSPRARPASPACTSSCARNEAAQRFYRAMGLTRPLSPGYYRGREAALRMIRVLRAPAAAGLLAAAARRRRLSRGVGAQRPDRGASGRH